MKNLRCFCVLLCSLFLINCTQEKSTEILPLDEENGISTPKGKTIVQKADIGTFQPAGPEGGAGNVLNPGEFFPPTKKSFATLKRGTDHIQVNIHTTGLPQGAYTVWYVIFNDPSSCSGGECGEDDLFNPTTAVLWCTGKIVHANGVGNFSDRLDVGEMRSETPILGGDLSAPLETSQGSEVHFIIKYHGLASSDPAILYDQLHTLVGNCGPTDGANSHDLGPPFGYQCFDPQVAIFPAP